MVTPNTSPSTFVLKAATTIMLIENTLEIVLIFFYENILARTLNIFDIMFL